MRTVLSIPTPVRKDTKGWAYCPICTHIVEAQVVISGKKLVTKPGQKCPRCSSSLEPASVVRYETAA